MVCDNVVLCKRPKTKLGKWLVYNHQVLRVIWVPPGENRQVLLGYLGDACNELCTSSNSCVRQVSPYDKMTVNILNATQYSTKENWAKCLKSAQQWRQTPGNALSQLACYFPNNGQEDVIACVVPLEGDACASEKKYQKMLTGTSSIAIIASFMMVPRTLEFVFSIIFFYCCRTAFDKGQRKTWKGLSLGVIVLAALAGIVVLLISSGGEGFIGLRISVWLATWVGSMLIFEPLVGLISYCCIRCGEPKFEADIDAKPTDTSPLLGSSDLPSTGEDSDRIVADVGDNEISDTNSSIRVDTDNSSTDIEKGLSPVYTHDPLASQDVDLGDASVSSDEEASVSMPINSEM